MTNAEKFKEVFPNVEVNESQKGFVVLHFKTKFKGHEYQESLAVWNSTWLADYQGTPTIPLSVIEDIKAEIKAMKYKPCCNTEMMAQNIAYGNVLGLINRKVNEVKGDKE